MPRRYVTLNKKHLSAVQHHDHILNKYNGDRNLIMAEGTKYKRTKEASSRSIYNYYKKLNRVDKIIKDLEEIIDFDNGNNDEQNAAP